MLEEFIAHFEEQSQEIRKTGAESGNTRLQIRCTGMADGMDLTLSVMRLTQSLYAESDWERRMVAQEYNTIFEEDKC